jgi:hypothetical protein
MGLGTGVVLVLAGLALLTNLIDLPGFLDSTGVEVALIALGVAIAVAGLAVHAARHRGENHA